MRELWISGQMHTRARMIVASNLTKHLLTDWDAANNAMGWPWVAGSGPGAAPYSAS